MGGGTDYRYQRPFDQQAWHAKQFEKDASAPNEVEEAVCIRTNGHSIGCACTTCEAKRRRDDGGTAST
jgi:hypothetical protein